MHDKLWYIKNADVFSGMTPQELEHLASISRMAQFRREEIIFLADDFSNHVYLIKEGRVKLSRIDSEGREMTLNILGPGELFGELATADEATRSHAATALDDGLMCIFSREDFKKVMETHPQLALQVVKLIGFRLRKLESRLEDLAFRSVSERVNGTLHRLAGEFGRKESNGAVRVPITQSQLAYLVGASRETVAEELGKMRRQGIVSTAYRSIILENMPELSGRS